MGVVCVYLRRACVYARAVTAYLVVEGCTPLEFSNVCMYVLACLPGPLYVVTYAWPPTTQWLLRTHTHKYNMYKTEFARIARESIVFSWHPPLPTYPIHIHSHYLVSRISPSPGRLGVTTTAVGSCPFPYTHVNVYVICICI